MTRWLKGSTEPIGFHHPKPPDPAATNKRKKKPLFFTQPTNTKTWTPGIVMKPDNTKKNKEISIFFYVACFLVIFSSPVFAQYVRHEYESATKLELNTDFTAPAKLEDQDVEVGYLSTGLRLIFPEFELGYQYTDYSWERPEVLSSGNEIDDPFEQLHRTWFIYRRFHMVDTSWGYRFGLGGYSGFEKEITDSFGGIAFAGMVYRTPIRDLQFVAGAGVNLHSVETTIYPLLGMEWNARNQSLYSAKISFPLVRGYPQTSSYPEARFSIHFSPSLALSAGLKVNEGMYRLENDSPLRKKGYLQTEHASGNIFLTFTPDPFLHLEAGGGWVFKGKYIVYDEEGDNETEYETDGSLKAMLNIRFVF